MSDTKRLLKFHPETAVLIVANERLGLHLRPEWARVTERQPGIDGKITVTIEGMESTDEGIPSPYSGDFRLSYNRLSLAQDMGSVTIQVSPPVTVRSAMQVLSKRTGLVFDANDFIDDVIDTHEYTLRADPDSLRWYGEVDIRLVELSDYIHDPIDPTPPDEPEPPVDEPTLWDIAPNTELSGFTPEHTRVELVDAIGKTELDGLKYNPPWLVPYVKLEDAILVDNLPGFTGGLELPEAVRKPDLDGFAPYLDQSN